MLLTSSALSILLLYSLSSLPANRSTADALTWWPSESFISCFATSNACFSLSFCFCSFLASSGVTDTSSLREKRKRSVNSELSLLNRSPSTSGLYVSTGIPRLPSAVCKSSYLPSGIITALTSSKLTARWGLASKYSVGIFAISCVREIRLSTIS